MSRYKYPVLALAVAAILGGCASTDKHPVHAAAHQLKVGETKSIEFSGTGRWFQFGQAPNPTLAWPPFAVSSYTADINYDTSSAHVQIARKQIVEPGRNRPTPVEQKPDQYISGTTAWNVAPAPNAAPGSAGVPSLQAAAVEERAAEIWSTPQGFLKAARDNHASSEDSENGSVVSFTVGGKYRYVGTINAKNEVESIQTWIDNPVLGDTLVETKFSDYKDFGGIQFPAHIVRTQGGHPVLDLNVSEVKLNPAVDIVVPSEIANAKPPAVVVKSERLANGVYYLTGGTHHSVAIEQKDHIVLVEAPLNEDRSNAVIAKAKELIPGKPIKFLVNTHAHFDHSGGLRTFVDEGATIVTEQANKDYYEKVWANPHTLNPDRLEGSKKTPQFAAHNGRVALSDGDRKIEIHSIAGNSHNDAFDLIYLPAEKILIEVDAYTPPAPGAALPTSVNPYSQNLYENIQKLKLDVAQIAPLHGPGVVKLNDLRGYIGLAKVEESEAKGKPGKAKAHKHKAGAQG
ncbi:MBL fold metallo-hydrolase [Methylococcus sp. EFPC2]|uniref:MBL fold metallo-hydrolase n=1 Tax=Methylococcus sp. EFPC2 TaxID=2812648 RepID=UPI0019671429|nr:MBL fold metallo-hydrolase [Methylococcus sp. EFPC2]QSA96441.1 MBL fold metallo-hydrolase [Methylococcus sp. EFPC2]